MGPSFIKRLEKDSADAIAPFFKKVDVEVYKLAGRDPHCPLLYGGNPKARIAFFGRDPGREEIKAWQPLIGISGQRARKALLGDLPLEKAKLISESSERAFYFNTVPYKPIGNKAWEPEVILAFRDIIASLLVNFWEGDTLFTLGTEAYQWFAEIGGDSWRTHWESENRYKKTLNLTIALNKNGTGKNQKSIRIVPLPHPSPLNRRYYDLFPGLVKDAIHRTTQSSL